jgi:hypothetical protein
MVFLKRDDLVDADLAERRVNIREAAHNGFGNEIAVQSAGIAAAVAAQNHHPGFFRDVVDSLTQGIAFPDYLGIIKEENHAHDLNAVLAFLNLRNDHVMQDVESPVAQENVSNLQFI